MKAYPRVTVLPIKKYLLKQLQLGKDEALIMLSSYPQPVIDSNTNFLFLPVDDVTKPSCPTAFKKSHAVEIVKFLEGQESLSHLYVCCDGGVSRSAAVAASLQYAWEGNDDAIWTDAHYHPNELVYSIMRNTLGIPCTKEELASKIAKSKDALFRKIRGSL